MKLDVIYNEDCLEGMKKLPDNSVDSVATDPPYSIGFMGKKWDQALPSVEIWRECLRVLKPGAFAFVMCIPRQDCLARMIVSLEDAGFNVGFSSIYWTYASGFPKAQNVSKVIDKKECREQLKEKLGRKPMKKEFDKEWEGFRRIVGKKGLHGWDSKKGSLRNHYGKFEGDFDKANQLTLPATPQAQALDGSYSGFQPKPAVEVVIVAMKPLETKTYVNQALKNRKGVTWLGDGRIPYENEKDREIHHYNAKGMDRLAKDYGEKLGTSFEGGWVKKSPALNNQGRFPANLLCSDNALNDGREHKSGELDTNKHNAHFGGIFGNQKSINPTHLRADSGSFSRYFSLDAWFDKKLKELPAGVQKTFPFLIVPKASKAEKNRGCEELYWEKDNSSFGYHQVGRTRWEWLGREEERVYEETGKRVSLRARGNIHPTVKPLKLGFYLATIGSREGDIILDPFGGSGWMAVVAKSLGRHYIVFETAKENVKIAKKRLANIQLELLK